MAGRGPHLTVKKASPRCVRSSILVDGYWVSPEDPVPRNPAQRTTRRWRQPEHQAAALNGALILIVPAVWLAYGDYTWEGGRPTPPTVLSSAVRALPVLLWLAPVSLLVAWRTYVHACAYRLKPITVLRGPVESAAISGGIALMLMVRATALSWSRQPFYLVIAYIAFYVGATALAGLVWGLLLAATALLVLRLRRVTRIGRAV